ncbi:MAG: hypothetical protein JEZ09_09000 [Salinivirgaceae bacterium]|nr:hypothetical protein [Salinivirgaceae bacterium]
MKKLLLMLIVFIGFSINSFAQERNVFKYQAVIRNSAGEIIANKSISLKINILLRSEDGTLVYSETHAKTTNNFGLVSLSIGNGTVIYGNYDEINWSSSKYFLQLEIDIDGGENYEFMGTSPLLSVPYALHAQTVSNSDDADADLLNEIQDIM